MKKITRILSLVVALALVVMSVSVTAVSTAADETTYTLSIENATQGTTYSAYQIFAGTVSDGKLTGITTGVDLTSLSDLITALKSAFTTTNISALSSTSTAAEVAAAINNDIAATADKETLVNVLRSVVDDSAKYTATASADGDVTISSVEGGYYLIVTNTSDSTGVALLVASNTTIDPKTSTTSTVKKDVTGSDYGVEADTSEEVSFTVTVTLPDNLYLYTDGYAIKLVDTLTNLTFDKLTSVTLYASGSTSGTDVKDSFTAENTTAEGAASNEETISGTLAADYCITTYNSGTVVFVYTAKVESDAYTYDGTTNSVILYYGNDPDDTTSLVDDDDADESGEVTVYEYTLVINKTDATTDETLNGAVFALVADGDDVDDDDNYIYATSSDGATTYDSADATSSVSTFYFIGLDTNISYTLIEVETPSGYTAINNQTIAVGEASSDGSIEIKLGDTAATATTTAGVYELTVTNSSSSGLPETGGMGTKIFYTLGGILVVGAGVLLIVKRRMRTA